MVLMSGNTGQLMMQRVILNLQRCLFEHPCVVVPGLGAFILHEVPVEEDSNRALLIPSKGKLTFNPEIQVADGLLAESYMKQYNLNYRRATMMMQKDVDDLLFHLSRQPSISLGELGRMRKGENGASPQFEPNPNHPFHTSSYGLQPVTQLPKLVSDAEGVKETSENVLYLPVNLKFLKYSAAAMVVLCLALLMPFRSVDGNLKEYQAGFVPEVFRQQEEQPKEQPIEPVEVEENVMAIDQEALNNSPFNIPYVEGSRGQELYYVIVASLSSEKQTKEYLDKVDTETLKDAGVYKRGNYYRVYAGYFETEQEAYNYRNEVASTSKAFKDAWVYKSN